MKAYLIRPTRDGESVLDSPEQGAWFDASCLASAFTRAQCRWPMADTFELIYSIDLGVLQSAGYR